MWLSISLYSPAGRNAHILKKRLYPSFYQTVETRDHKKLESLPPKEVYAGRKKRLKLGSSHEENLPPPRRFHTVTTACQTILYEETN